MQHLRPGELITLENDGEYFVFLILSKSAFFGCQWSLAFHQYFQAVPSVEQVQLNTAAGFVALIDFIDERRSDSVLRITKSIDVGSYLAFDYMKAFIRNQNGEGEWYIYRRNFEIADKKYKLEPHELDYPIASGMKARDAYKLIKGKWTPRTLVHPGESGQFPGRLVNK